jgi:hypothetical protein
MLCNFVRDETSDEDAFECHAVRPKLSVVNHDNTAQSQTEDPSDDISHKEKWFKAYAVQQLEFNPNLILCEAQISRRCEYNST